MAMFMWKMMTSGLDSVFSGMAQKVQAQKMEGYKNG
jgi:hypothetical protein